MKFKALSSLLCTALLSACSGSDSSSGDSAAKFDYIVNTNTSELAAVNTATAEVSTVFGEVLDVFTAGKLNAEGRSEIAAVMAMQAGRFVFVTNDNKQPTVFSSLQGATQSSLCKYGIQDQGDTPSLIYSTPGLDGSCASTADNEVYYVDISMDETTDPIKLTSNVWATARRTQEVYAQGQLMGYLVLQQGEQASLSYHNRLFTQSRALQLPANYDANRFGLYVLPFLNSDRNLIILGGTAYDRSATELESAGLGDAILEGDTQILPKLNAEQAYLATSYGLFRHEPGGENVEQIRLINDASIIDASPYQGGGLVIFEDSNNDRIKRFVQVDSSSELLAYRPVLDADYDATGTTRDNIDLYAAERSTLVNIKLEYAATDDQAYALLINSDGQVTRFDNALWLPYSNGDYYANVPLLLKQGESGPNLVLVDETQPESQRVLGTLPSDTTQVDIAEFQVGAQVLLTVETGLFDASEYKTYRMEPARANSLELVEPLESISLLNRIVSLRVN